MSRLQKLALLVIVLAAIIAAGWWMLHAGDPTAFAKGKRVELADFKGPDPTGVPASLANAELVARGEYLARAADCEACHSAPGGKPFAGGLPFKLPMIGTIYSTNITPDQETGIGTWSDEDFLKALHRGIGKDGKHLYPAFPYPSYALMTDGDVLAIKAYLLTLKPIKNTPPANDVSFPFNQRYLMMFWNTLFKPSHRFRPNADQPADWNRGAYLVEALGHCGDCHTPRNILFGLNNKRKFAGAIIQGWKAYNITPDRDWGIGSWSDEQLEGYLSTGHALGRGSAGGPMSEVVDNSLRHLSAPDLKAIVTYLKSVPHDGDGTDIAAAPTPMALKEVRELPAPPGESGPGLHVFEGACIGCHQFDGKGAVSNFASLVGSRTVNDPAGTNAAQALIGGTHLRLAKTAGFMPDFGNGYSDAEIAAVVNYVTGRFGARASALTPGDIKKRRDAD
ncbi:MAG TPA: cytochrome c [Hyphomicrobiaceae bacterium]|nr:cytochrome c [Hyphomicrobiaceae bacterium]